MKIPFVNSERRALRQLFDSQFLLRQLPPSLRGTAVTLDQYINETSFRELSPHPLFDSQFYLESNPDVDRSGINPLVHFVQLGWRDGRDPHPFFDMNFYRVSYLKGKLEANPLIEYQRKGAAKGNKPYAGFDYDLYRNLVSPRCKNQDILKDFVENYHEPSRQKFAATLTRRALLSNPRIPANYSGELPAEPAGSALFCDIVIPVKNSIHWVARSLDSTRAALQSGQVAQVLLIDDGCCPESCMLLNGLVESFADTRVRVIRNDGAHGFGAACNLGARSGSAPYILFLNSDCILSKDSVLKMLRAFESDSSIGLTCPPSNNAANVSIPMLPGLSFPVMSELLAERQASAQIRYPEICTIVGHCLMLSRLCFESVNGFDESWGLGYGEESDLHLRARARGFLGVLTPDTYVYHFGGATFLQEAKRDQLQQENHRRFLQLWGDSFSTFYRSVAPASPILGLRRLRSHKRDCCDILFVLPGLTKGVGGVQVVVDLANFLIAQGVDARTVVLGDFDYGTLSTYGEPMYFNLYHCKSEREFLECFSVRPRLVVATLFATAPAAYKFARRVDARLVNFVQGYEFYFTDGRFYEHVRDSYYLADCSIATSKWLAENVRRHLPNGDVEQLPLGIDLNLFYPAKTRQGSTRMRVGMVIRSAPDKGQYVLRELCDRLLRYQQDITLTIFVPRDYNFASAWSYSDQECVEVPLPADRVTIASALRAVDVFIDASLHEGYGLFPLEAMACGACVIASDSGGTTQFLSHGRNGYIVSAVNQPDEYLRYIEALTENRSLLSSLQDAALQTAMLYKDSSLFASYGELFTRMLSEYPGTSATAGSGACSTELLPLFRP